MEKLNRIWLFLLIILGFVLIVINSCKKDNNTEVQVPVLETSLVSDITATTSSCGGVISTDNGSSITVRGVCWGINSTPTTADSKTTDGAGAGIFTSAITGLNSGTTYYVRAYATNGYGTGYGSAVSFTTIAYQVPVLTTTTVFPSNTTATCGGDVTFYGGSEVTARGVCWSTGTSPTIADSKTTDGAGTGTFSSALTGLSILTTYYIRAYATNITGTGYGNTISFSTIGQVMDVDGNVYNTVQIGSQIWMAENLRTTMFADGTNIPLVTVAADWAALAYTDKAYCYYDNLSTNISTYGNLYKWAAAMNGSASSSANPSGIQGVCPDGWHLPSDAEWKQLEMFLGMSQSQADSLYWRGTTEGGKLKEAGTSHWQSPNKGAVNSCGFTALPGGYCYYNGAYASLVSSGCWWTATESGTGYALERLLSYDIAKVYRMSGLNAQFGYSVRCVKDN